MPETLTEHSGLSYRVYKNRAKLKRAGEPAFAISIFLIEQDEV